MDAKEFLKDNYESSSFDDPEIFQETIELLEQYHLSQIPSDENNMLTFIEDKLIETLVILKEKYSNTPEYSTIKLDFTSTIYKVNYLRRKVFAFKQSQPKEEKKTRCVDCIHITSAPNENKDVEYHCFIDGDLFVEDIQDVDEKHNCSHFVSDMPDIPKEEKVKKSTESICEEGKVGAWCIGCRVKDECKLFNK